MLHRTAELIRKSEGCYLRDADLDAFTNYIEELPLRTQIYQRLQLLEGEVIRDVESKLRFKDASLFQVAGEDVSSKWKTDTIRTYRFIAKTVLLDDVEMLRQEYLLWMTTVMKAFGASDCCGETYALLERVLSSRLSSREAEHVLPVVRLVQQTLAG